MADLRYAVAGLAYVSAGRLCLGDDYDQLIRMHKLDCARGIPLSASAEGRRGF